MIWVFLGQSKVFKCNSELRFELDEIFEPLYFELEKELLTAFPVSWRLKEVLRKVFNPSDLIYRLEK